MKKWRPMHTLNYRLSPTPHAVTLPHEFLPTSLIKSSHRLNSKSKNWHFHFSRYKSLIRSWTLVMCCLSVAPKTISNMYPVAAMWVTGGWTQLQTLEYLCSYDHQKLTPGKSKVLSSNDPIRRWTGCGNTICSIIRSWHGLYMKDGCSHCGITRPGRLSPV